MIKAIFGLGNPGKKYQDTRHNLGFRVVDKVVKLKDLKPVNSKFSAEVFKAESVFLVKPLSFMNLSGDVMGKFINYFKILPREVLVILDDLNQPIGQIRIRFSGGTGGHRGLESIIQSIGQDFWRARVGIGKPEENLLYDKYVLQKIETPEKEKLSLAVDRLAEYLISLLGKSINPEQQTFKEN